MKVLLAAIIILLAFSAIVNAQTVIYRTFPGTTVPDYSQPAYVVPNQYNINSDIARGVGAQAQPFDWNRARENALINKNLELQNELLRRQLQGMGK